VRCDLAAEVGKGLATLKWFIWHGNVFRAPQTAEDLECQLDDVGGGQAAFEQVRLVKAVREFDTYIRANADRISNYGERTPRRGDHLQLLRRVRRQPGHQQRMLKKQQITEPHAEPTSSYRSAPASSTTNWQRTSTAGIPASPTPLSIDKHWPPDLPQFVPLS